MPNVTRKCFFQDRRRDGENTFRTPCMLFPPLCYRNLQMTLDNIEVPTRIYANITLEVYPRVHYAYASINACYVSRNLFLDVG